MFSLDDDDCDNGCDDDLYDDSVDDDDGWMKVLLN